MEKIILRANNNSEDQIVLSTEDRKSFRLETFSRCLPECLAVINLSLTTVRGLGWYLENDSLAGSWHTVFCNGFSDNQPKLSCLTPAIFNDEGEMVLNYRCELDIDFEEWERTIPFSSKSRLKLINFCRLMQQPVSQPVEPPAFGLA